MAVRSMSGHILRVRWGTPPPDSRKNISLYIGIVVSLKADAPSLGSKSVALKREFICQKRIDYSWIIRTILASELCLNRVAVTVDAQKLRGLA